jgi:8-oxo-dGTP diphosphatase
LDGFAEKDQPGVHVRRVGGRNLTDAEMINHYAALAAEFEKNHGKPLTARYRNAIAVIANDKVFECFDDSIASSRFRLMAKPHPIIEDGFPINSISAELTSGRYYNDIRAEQANEMDAMPGSRAKNGFETFFGGILHELSVPVV